MSWSSCASARRIHYRFNESSRGLSSDWRDVLPEQVIDIEEPWHGTPNGYKKQGCRCDACTAAASAQRLSQIHRQELKVEELPDPTYEGPIFRCPWCSWWRIRVNGEPAPNCPHHDRAIEMSATTRTEPVASVARGTWAEDL